MSKPHEETWKLEEVIVMHNRHDGQKEAREVLGHAAPDMARALLDILKNYECGATVDAMCRIVLTKAGVPLP